MRGEATASSRTDHAPALPAVEIICIQSNGERLSSRDPGGMARFGNAGARHAAGLTALTVGCSLIYMHNPVAWKGWGRWQERRSNGATARPMPSRATGTSIPLPRIGGIVGSLGGTGYHAAGHGLGIAPP